MIACIRKNVGVAVAFVAPVLLALPASAQQQYQGLCARVKMVIPQELTLERIGFEATLEITNNDGEDPITDLSASLTFENPSLSTNGTPNDASSLFFVKTPTLQSINSIDGTGVIAPTTKAIAKWFLIPKIAAGGTSPSGVPYRVGCRLSGKIRGVEIPGDVLFAIPATIVVKPDPQLDITYFQPRDVQADDPFTPQVESPIPFTLGVLVKNSGYGPARKLKIDSQQPKIVENKNGLLLVAQLLGARVNDSPRSSSLLVDLGDIQPAQTQKGAWDMITSLSGTFTEFKATYTHASELGGEETSVIKSLEAHFIAHEVMNDQPGRDGIKDFLADVDRDENEIPDTLYESQGNVLAVHNHTNAAVVGSAGPGGSFQVNLQADVNGWGYIRLTDPGQARLKIASVTRSDGKNLNTNNYWTNIKYTKVGNIRLNWLNIFDLVELGQYTYTVTYAIGGVDADPPVTTLHFAGAVTEAGGKFYITPDTQMYFISDDVNPVSIVYSITNGPFLPALPFQLPNAGEYQLVYYATDSSNNREVNHTNILVVSGDATLDFSGVQSPFAPIFVSGDALSVRPASAPFTFQVGANPAATDARLDIFQGVIGFATVGNVPSSPTAANSASLTIAGDNVDFYKYRLDGGPWTSERPVAQSLTLSGLAAGLRTVSVLGRSQYGAFPADSNAVSVAWTVSATAPATRVTGTPATPSRNRTATLLVSGTGVTDYRWTLNGGFYRAETPISNPILLSSFTGAVQTLSVNAKISGTFQGTNNATTVQWKLDPLFGHDLSPLPLVRSVLYSNVGTAVQSFTWDGRSSNGVILPPGAYTVRVTIFDSLGRTNFATRVLNIDDLSGGASSIADVIRGPKNPYARRNLAVWQDQSDGTWQIYAQDLASNGAPVLKLTTGVLAQENARTDGRYVVWQGRQTNGNWDVFVKDLLSTNGPQNLTGTLARDEINPSIDWPWVVLQSRSNRDPGAPWNVRAINLANGFTEFVSLSTQDELNPDVQAGRVAWQDWRDVGPGEIYFKNLETGESRRITTNTFGQYNPAIFDNWIVWQDNRHGQVDLYAFDFARNREIRITDTPENETRVYLDGSWAVCEEDSLGALVGNVRLVHLPSLRAVPLTRTTSSKARPSLAGSRIVWQDTQNNQSSILTASVPSLQAVFANENAVAVTPAMVGYQQNAFTLLSSWHVQAGVDEIVRYSSLVPNVVAERAYWSNGAPAGVNFNLTAGSFLWIKFNDRRVLELGVNSANSLNLASGVSVFSHAGFPSTYSAYQLLRQVGLANARAVRMLDSESGNWKVTTVSNGQLFGPDFLIPKVAVLMLDMANPVTNFKPQ